MSSNWRENQVLRNIIKEHGYKNKAVEDIQEYSKEKEGASSGKPHRKWSGGSSLDAPEI